MNYKAEIYFLKTYSENRLFYNQVKFYIIIEKIVIL